MEKSRGEHAFDTLKLYEKSLLSSFKKSMLPDRDRMPLFFLLSSPKEVSDSSLSYMMGVVQRKWDPRGRDRFYVRNGKLSCEKLFNDLRAQKKPLMILSTAFSLKTFLDFLIQEKKLLRLKPGSRLMETGGFKGRAKEISKKALYRQCQKLLGLPLQACRSEYGMTELSSQYYAQGLSAQSASAWIRYRVMNPVTGQEVPLGSKGILRHYDLANRGSVMAIETQDLAIQGKNGFELVGRVPTAAPRGCSLAYEN